MSALLESGPAYNQLGDKTLKYDMDRKMAGDASLETEYTAVKAVEMMNRASMVHTSKSNTCLQEPSKGRHKGALVGRAYSDCQIEQLAKSVSFH